jgi:hypothetical protein
VREDTPWQASVLLHPSYIETIPERFGLVNAPNLLPKRSNFALLQIRNFSEEMADNGAFLIVPEPCQ